MKQSIAIIGNAGIGKSQVAKRYSEIYKENYDIVWWLDSEKNLADQIKNLAYEWNKFHKNNENQINLYLKNEEIIKQLKEQLRVTNLNWLLIFDNVTDKDTVIGYFPQKHNGFGHILVTSKNSNSWGNIMKLDKFTRNESVALLSKITNSKEKQELNHLANALNDFPLAIVQAASYIKSHPTLSIEEYTNLFINKREELWAEEEKIKDKHLAFDNYKFTVQTTMSLTIKEIKKQLPEAFDLLVFCSYLNSKNLPVDLLKQYLINKNKNNLLEQDEIIANLIKYSLISVNEEISESKNKTFTIHEMTQLATQAILNNSQKTDHLKDSLKAAANFFSDKLDINLPLLFNHPYLLAHIQILINNAEKFDYNDDNLITLRLRELEYFLSGKRDFVFGGSLINKIEKKLKNISDINKCRFHLMKSVLFAWRDGDYQKAIDESLKALKLINDKQNMQEDLLMAYNRIIQCYNHLGDNKNALKYAILGENVLTNAKGYLGNKDAFYHSLAKIHMDEGNSTQALNYISKAISVLNERVINFMPSDITIYILEAEILIKDNKILEAKEKLEILHAKAKESLLTNHQFFSNIIIFKSYVDFLNGNSKAIEDLKQAQEKLKTLLDEKNYYRNRIISLSYTFLGEIYEAQKNDSNAIHEYLTCLQILKNLYSNLDNVHTVDLSDIYTKIAIISVKLQEPATAQEYLNFHRKNFGFEHKNTILITDFLINNGMKIEF